jgi:hypothetical protein
MQQKPDILCVVEGGMCRRTLLGLLLVAGLAGVDALEDAQAAEVGKSDLQEFEGLVAGDVRLGRTFFALSLWSITHLDDVTTTEGGLRFAWRKNFAPSKFQFQFSSRDHRRDKLFLPLQQKDGSSV